MKHTVKSCLWFSESVPEHLSPSVAVFILISKDLLLTDPGLANHFNHSVFNNKSLSVLLVEETREFKCVQTLAQLDYGLLSPASPSSHRSHQPIMSEEIFFSDSLTLLWLLHTCLIKWGFISLYPTRFKWIWRLLRTQCWQPLYSKWQQMREINLCNLNCCAPKTASQFRQPRPET